MKFRLLLIFSLFISSLFINLNFGAMGNLFADNLAQILSYRLPHTLATAFIGAFLGISGLVYQAVFRNPLVSPDILGSSAGASLGIVVALFFGVNAYFIPVIALIFGVSCTFLVLLFVNLIARQSILLLIITGILFSSFLMALLNLLYYLLPEQSAIIGVHYFLMGSLSNLDSQALYLLLLFGGMGLIGVSLLVKWLDLFISPIEILQTQGLKVNLWMGLIILFATMLSTTTVSVAGIIGWVSLIIPNIVKIIYKAPHKVLLPVVGLSGGAFLLLTDVLARNITFMELPIGVITGMTGIPVFIGLMLYFLRTPGNRV